MGRLPIVWREAARAFLVIPEKFATAAGLILWMTVAGAMCKAWRDLDVRRRNQAYVLTTAWAGCLFLEWFWGGGIFFTVIPAACLIGLTAIAAGPRLGKLRGAGRSALIATFAAGVLALGAWNGWAGLWPQSRIEGNTTYDQAMYLKAHTVPTSYIVIAGVVNSNLKVYIPNFAGRQREVLEYYFLSRPKDEALRLFSAFIAQQVRCGVPLYILGEIISDVHVHEEMRRLWGVSSEEIRAAFGPGRLIGVASRQDIAVNLFVPASGRPELFAGLSYSILNEMEMPRITETALIIKELAREMTPAERHRAGVLLRSSGWGYDLLLASFLPRMNATMRVDAAARRGRFVSYQKTADFWLRVGNLYELLGLKVEMLDAWSKARTLSGNQDLLRVILNRKRSK